MKVLDTRTTQVLCTALIFALVLLFLYSAWRAILAFLFAIFFAYLLEAPVSRVQRWLRGSRGAAIAVVYLLFAVVMAVVLSLMVPPVAHEGQKLAQQVPEWSNRITSQQIAEKVGTRYGWSQATVNRIGDFLSEHRAEMLTTTQDLVLRAVRSLQNTWWLILVPILAIFFLRDGERFCQIIIESVEEPRNREVVAAAVNQMNSMLGYYIRAQLSLSLGAMVVLTIFLSLMRVPYAVALGPAAGALEFIPAVGPVVGGLMIVGVALLSGYNHIWWVVIGLVLWRGIQDYICQPRLMSGTLELHPLAVFFGVLAGGEVAGVIGIFLSIPVMASLRILWHTWQVSRGATRPASAVEAAG